ncbi:MAG: arsenate reductase family protein [Bacteroidota bacterium]
MIKIYHNNSCSKSCSALAAIKQTGEAFELVEYLKEVPSIKELTTIVAQLECSPHDLIRVNESVYQQQFKEKNLSDEEWIRVMHENPILIQRPIIINGNKATVARTAVLVKDAIG